MINMKKAQIKEEILNKSKNVENEKIDMKDKIK